jgi:hypothetical protein
MQGILQHFLSYHHISHPLFDISFFTNNGREHLDMGSTAMNMAKESLTLILSYSLQWQIQVFKMGPGVQRGVQPHTRGNL